MSQFEKALARLLSQPKDFTWRELQTIMSHLGFIEKKGSGSRRKFVHLRTTEPLRLHEPHPFGILKRYAIREVLDYLTRHNYL